MQNIAARLVIKKEEDEITRYGSIWIVRGAGGVGGGSMRGIWIGRGGSMRHMDRGQGRGGGHERHMDRDRGGGGMRGIWIGTGAGGGH